MNDDRLISSDDQPSFIEPEIIDQLESKLRRHGSMVWRDGLGSIVWVVADRGQLIDEVDMAVDDGKLAMVAGIERKQLFRDKNLIE